MSRLSSEDREALAALQRWHVVTDMDATVIVVDRIVARHVAAALNEAARATEAYVAASNLARRTFLDYRSGRATDGAVDGANDRERAALARLRKATTP